MSWVLLTGQIRNAEMALAQASQLARLRAAGLVEGVVFSTWKGEFAKYPDVLKAVSALGATCLESEPPQIYSPGYVLHQSLAMMQGLELIPDGARVLRMRPDVAPINEMIDHVISGDWLTNDYGTERPTAFRNKVWAHSGLMTWPFYINDMLFFAEKADFRKLCAVQPQHEWLFSDLAPEQFFHLGPVADVNPVVRTYARIQRGKHSPELNDRLQAILWGSDFWYDLLWAYARELVSNYHIGFQFPSDIYSGGHLALFSSVSITDLTSGAVKLPHCEYFSHAGGTFFHSLGWAQALLTGHFLKDAAWERLMARQASDETAVAAAAGDLQAALSEAFEDYEPRHPVPAGHILQYKTHRNAIRGMADNDHVRSLESEINALRRRVDRLDRA